MSYSRKRPLEQNESEGDFKQKQEKLDSYEASCEESQGSSIASTISTTTNELRVDNIKDILNTLKHGHFSSSKWYSLGIQLRLLPASLKEIEANHRGDVGRCLAECLESWLSKGDHCTWDSLEDALEKIEENTTAKEIKQRRIKEAHQMYFDALSNTLMHPLEVAKRLFDDKCISEAEFNKINWLEGSLDEKNLALLSTLRTAISSDNMKLKRLALVLSEFEETKLLSDRIISDNGFDKSFSDSQIPLQNAQDIVTGCSDQLSQAHTTLSTMNSYDESFNDRDAQKTEVHSDKPFTEESYNQVSLPDNQEAEITLKIHVKNTSGVAISLLKGGTIPLSLICTIQAISSFRIISPALNKERGEEGLNVSSGIGVERQNVNADEIDSMDGEESCQNQENDANLMKDDSQQQLVHYMLDNEQQEERRQSKADQNQGIMYRAPTCPHISQQHSSQLKEEQKREEDVPFSVSKDEYVPKYLFDQMKMTADALDTAYKEQTQNFDATKSELEKYKGIHLRTLEMDQQNKEEKRKRNERTQIKRKRTETLKHYITVHLHGWEVVSSSIKHLPSNLSMEFKLMPSCPIKGRVDFSNEEVLSGTVHPADTDELERLRNQDH